MFLFVLLLQILTTEPPPLLFLFLSSPFVRHFVRKKEIKHKTQHIILSDLVTVVQTVRVEQIDSVAILTRQVGIQREDSKQKNKKKTTLSSSLVVFMLQTVLRHFSIFFFFFNTNVMVCIANSRFRNPSVKKSGRLSIDFKAIV